MTPLQHIAVDRQTPQPWRNGGGSTRTLFTWPGAARPWLLRISVADITQDGPFSAFAGVDRWFAVLQGAGVVLQLPGGSATQTVHSAPLQFAGDAAPGCQRINGPTRDLNLMLQRGTGQAQLHDATPGQPWLATAPLRGLFTTAALQLQIDGGPAQPVAAWSLVLASAPHTLPAPQRWQIGHLPGGEHALWLAFSPEAPKP